MPYNDRPIPEAFQCRKQDPPKPRTPRAKIPPVASTPTKIFLVAAAAIGLALHPEEKATPPTPKQEEVKTQRPHFGSPDYTSVQPLSMKFYGSSGSIIEVPTPCIPIVDITGVYKLNGGKK